MAGAWLQEGLRELALQARRWLPGPKAPRALRTVPGDDVAWTFSGARRVVAVGDVHGDLVGLASILVHRGLISKRGRWTGGDTHLVLNGDLVGGKQTRLLIDFVLRLQKEADRQGGTVHAVLGNHDLWALRHARQRPKLLRRLPVGDGATSLAEAFSGDTAWAQWLRQRNAIVRIDDTLFVHAGVNTWALEHDPGRVNASVRRWIRYWQGLEEEPDRSTRWTVERPDVDWTPPTSGPLWTRSFKSLRNAGPETIAMVTVRAPGAKSLERILAKLRVRRMVIGHAPTPGKRITLSHPTYGDRVVMIDTRISDTKRGRLSCLEICAGKLEACYPKRKKAGKRIRERELERIALG